MRRVFEVIFGFKSGGVYHSGGPVKLGSNYVPVILSPKAEFIMSPEEFEFNVSDKVEKIGGDYTFEGHIVAVFHKRSGLARYVVEDDRGVLHVFNGRIMRRIGADEAEKVQVSEEEEMSAEDESVPMTYMENVTINVYGRGADLVDEAMIRKFGYTYHQEGSCRG